MIFGVRGKLFGVSLALILIVGTASGLIAEHELRQWMVDREHAELLRIARTARRPVERAYASGASLDALADSLGEASDRRITFIGPDGRVLGDSAIATNALDSVESHGARPEAREALAQGRGFAQRYSTTVGQPLLYSAVPFDAGEQRGIVRTAMHMDEIRGVVHELRMLLILAAILGVVAATAMSGLASHLLSRALEQLVERARTLASGERRRIEVSSTDELGRLAGSFNLLAAELEGTVATLADERDRFETVLEGMSEAVLAIDGSQRVTLANPAACSLLRLPSLPTGKLLVEAVRLPALHEIAVQGRDEPVSRELTRVEGSSTYYILARATPMRAGGTVIVMHDVTEIRRLETVRRDFVANVSHELRTPVSVIRANAETLLQGALEDPQAARRFLQGISRNTERLSRIIADLLDLARIEAGRYEVQLKPVTLEQAVKRSLEAIEATARDKGIELQSNVPSSFKVLADVKALDQILLNLLENAVKYTPDGGHVQVAATAADGKVRIEVRDDGPGIDRRYRERIFERFYRVDPGRSRDLGGTGLGLSIVKHLVETMRGGVGVEPAEPHGSVFWVTLPATRISMGT